jgi:hypothetical protein
MRMSTLPPSWMSVPRPAMLVAIVIAPGAPACAMMVGLLLVVARVEHLVRDLLLGEHRGERLDFSIDTVPTSIGCWRARHSSTSATIESVFSRSVR